MPRNVVTVWPRLWRRKHIEAHLAENFRFRRKFRSIEIDFPKRMDRQAARQKVVDVLSESDRRWRLWYRLLPRKRAAR